MIRENFEYTSCLTCLLNICLHCSLEQHEGITCDEQWEIYQDKLYLELKKITKIVRCPQCKMGIQQVGRCRFLTCQCCTLFCPFCEDFLEQKIGYEHFSRESLFACPNLEDKEQYRVNKAQQIVQNSIAVLNKMKMIQSVQKNNIACPCCKNFSKEFSKLIFFDKFIICSSNKCKGSIYCIICQQKIQQQQIKNHLNKYLKCLN